MNGGSTLENSFGHGISTAGGVAGLSNKSYERILAETIEAQNAGDLGVGGATANYSSN